MSTSEPFYFVYFAQSSVDLSFYIGFTSNLDKRLLEHNAGKTKSLESKLPVKLVYYEAYNNSRSARKREIYLKKVRAAKIEIIKRILDTS